MDFRQCLSRIFSNANKPILEGLIEFLDVTEKLVFDSAAR